MVGRSTVWASIRISSIGPVSAATNMTRCRMVLLKPQFSQGRFDFLLQMLTSSDYGRIRLGINGDPVELEHSFGRNIGHLTD
jgi:hypothetical protein